MPIPKFKSTATDTVIVYELIRRLATPFIETEAFKAGLITPDGKFIKKRAQMTPAEKKLLTRFDVMIFNLKRLLAKAPGGDSKLRNFATALFLLKEEHQFGLVTEDDVVALAEELDFSETRKLGELTEEIANSIGSGTISDKTVAVRKKPKTSKFGKCMVFEVDSDDFSRARFEKKKTDRFDKHIKGETLDAIRDYSRQNPGKSIMISDPKTGAMSVLKLGSKEKW